MKSLTLNLLALATFAVLLTACVGRAAEYDAPVVAGASEGHEQGVFHYDRAFERLGQADYDNAVADMDRARGLIDAQLIHLYSDGMHDVYFQSGIAYYDTGLYDDAVRLFDKAVDVVVSPSDYPDAYYWRGMAHYRRERYRLAIADFDMLVGMEGEYPDAAHYRGLAQEGLAK